MAPTQERVAVYGATGFLGRLVLARLVRAGATPVAVGRRREAVEKLAADAGITTVEVAGADDPPALRRALDGCAVTVNCAPVAACGEHIVRGALESRTHYVDAAGEQSFLRRLFDDFNDEAASRGVVLAPGCGFDYAIGDCLARLSARGHEPAADVRVAYAIEGGDVSANSVNAAIGAPRGREVVYRRGAWRPLPLEIDRAAHDFPPPLGRQQMSRYGSGEVITVPRHTTTRRVTTLITSRSLCPNPSLLPIFPVLRPAVGLALRFAPARALVNMAARASRGAPTAAAVAVAPRRFVVDATTVGEDRSVGRATAEGGDFHDVTAAVLAFAAMVLLDHTTGGGTRAPSTVFSPEALLNHLATEGVRWTST